MSTVGKTPTIANLYPQEGDDTRAEIEDVFDRYLRLVIRIADGALADPELAKEIKMLTAQAARRTLETERSNIENGRTANV